MRARSSSSELWSLDGGFFNVTTMGGMMTQRRGSLFFRLTGFPPRPYLRDVWNIRAHVRVLST